MYDLSIKQNFKPPLENKTLYGEVNTPFHLIQEMLDLFPKEIFSNPNLKWLDPAAGCGYFPMVLYNNLMNGLQSKIKSREKRKIHILKHMIYMCELNEENIKILKQTFGKDANIIHLNFLSTTLNSFDTNETTFDVILGNPPYNYGGLKKVPTNAILNKKQDGITLWHDFIKHSISLLRENGYLNMIIPSIWMKPDKAKMYDYLTQYKLHNIRAFTNTQTNHIFKGQAQTPTCYFLLQKTFHKNDSIGLYNELTNNYIDYPFKSGSSIPLLGASIIQKLQYFTDKYGTIQYKKTNLPGKYTTLSNIKDTHHPYINIRTTILKKLEPQLVLQYSSKPCCFHGEKKIILSHKMYGFPFYDKDGIYGISNRDNYVIYGYSHEEMVQLFHFFNTKLVMFLYETTRYRMKYLEKYVFEFIPNILKINNFPNEINDENINLFFGFSQQEINYLMNFHKHYKQFPI
jgi:tRNA1(Val) A37 N6-methylase TrmN6